VKAVRAPPQDVKPPVNLGKRRKREGVLRHVGRLTSFVVKRQPPLIYPEKRARLARNEDLCQVNAAIRRACDADSRMRKIPA
jgi:hypothetical protein